ncbi:hypothetical protein chiPu_0021845 [Chiloscyllium punctatum]|uniref:Uncharacterized protein n=1 Tax=Chiloscyllium punctatum TaxID=137246 RepID=A0A401RNB3_CHIPU|nr:hypothetical protein [Chiloscyllium punctatum]
MRSGVPTPSSVIKRDAAPILAPSIQSFKGWRALRFELTNVGRQRSLRGSQRYPPSSGASPDGRMIALQCAGLRPTCSMGNAVRSWDVSSLHELS